MSRLRGSDGNPKRLAMATSHFGLVSLFIGFPIKQFTHRRASPYPEGFLKGKAPNLLSHKQQRAQMRGDTTLRCGKNKKQRNLLFNGEAKGTQWLRLGIRFVGGTFVKSEARRKSDQGKLCGAPQIDHISYFGGFTLK